MPVASTLRRAAALMFGGLWLLVAPASNAAVQDITAVFRPDPGNPMVNKFTNTTPQSGVCPGHMPARCEALGIFSIRTEAIKFNSIGPMAAGETDSRKRVMFKVPSDWQSFQVTSSLGEQQTVQMRISGIGNRFDIPNPPGVLAWGADPNWTNPPAPCQHTGMWAAGPTLRLWFWLIPEGAGACGMASEVDIPRLHYFNFEYTYELRTPNPLGMSTGQYNGSITFTIGPNMDFDFGDIMIPTDNLLTFNFTLDVEHTLKVDVPPGGNQVELLPQGGWQAWLQRNRRPERLFRDQTFNLSASSRFRMNLECQYTDGGDNCSIQEPVSGHRVPLNIAVSLPDGITDGSGQSVNRRRLVRDGTGTELFLPGHYLDRKPGTLHFEVGTKDVESMLDGVSKAYRGQVTVIWDSAV